MAIPKRFLFRFRVPCRYFKEAGALAGDDRYLLPSLSEMEGGGKHLFPCRFKAGWNEDGLAFSLRVSGKRQAPWCRQFQFEESDGLHLYIDTRDIQSVHRATRFCHRLVFLPTLDNKTDLNSETKPLAIWSPIHRAKEHPNPIATERIAVQSFLTADGYRLLIEIPGLILTGYEPNEYSSLGFHFAIQDRELGSFAYVTPSPFPHDNDPSLWTSLQLQR